jgi:hypothetical protein|tara:strand:+ start:250 stop:459 length:210 start_codon:yes stop_codon:yes gene_type:complete
MKLSNWTDQEIGEYLLAPATAQQRYNALAVHSLGDIQAERKAEQVSAVREEFGLDYIPEGSGQVLTGRK